MSTMTVKWGQKDGIFSGGKGYQKRLNEAEVISERFLTGEKNDLHEIEKLRTNWMEEIGR